MVNSLDSLDLFPGGDANEEEDSGGIPVRARAVSKALFQIEKNVSKEVS
jgi:hypothetical protein